MDDEDITENEGDLLPAGFAEAVDRFRLLVALLYSSKNLNDINFLLLLSSDINLFRLYMQYTEIDLVFDAVRFLFLMYPSATKSKKIKTTFCKNISRIKNQIPNKL